jgi:S1-C subfamily serine protease
MNAMAEVKRLTIFFAATAIALLALLHFEVVDRVAFHVERGRLRAAREVLSELHQTQRTENVTRSVAQTVLPAVISVTADLGVVDNMDASAADHPGTGGPAARKSIRPRELFPPTDDAVADPPATPRSRSQGIGSGFVFDGPKGLILTNGHVVRGARSVRVTLADGRSADARILGVDTEETDLAVLEVDLPRLHELPMALDDDAAIGDEVLAVGNPFGLDGTFSKGIISAFSRRQVSLEGHEYVGMLQTDAVINPGNSGGPLVNMRGEVIGVNTAIATSSGHFEGVGFAIPAARIRRIVPELIAGGPTVLGVGVEDAWRDPWRAEALGWPRNTGAIILSLSEGRGAQRAGLRLDDVIMTVDGMEVTSAGHLTRIAASGQHGMTVDVEYWRDGAAFTVPVTLERKYAPLPAAEAP